MRHEFIYRSFYLERNFRQILASYSSGIQSRIGRSIGLQDGGLISLALIKSGFGELLDHSKMDILNLHWVQGEMLSLGEIKGLNTPLIMTLHDPWITSGMGHYSVSHNNLAHKKFLELLDNFLKHRKKFLDQKILKFLTPSRWLADYCIERGFDANKFTVLRNPLNLSIFRPLDKNNLRAKYGISDSANVIYLSALTSLSDTRKGFDLALSITESIRKEVPNLEVISAGSKSLHFDSSIRWLGNFKSEVEIAELYSLADITLLPSRIDNLPQVMTESLSCGTPVAAFAVGGIPEIVNANNGFIARPYCVQEISEGVSEILSQPKKFDSLKISQDSVALWDPHDIRDSYKKILFEIIR